jgi:hypothetical protein
MVIFYLRTQGEHLETTRGYIQNKTRFSNLINASVELSGASAGEDGAMFCQGRLSQILIFPVFED